MSRKSRVEEAAHKGSLEDVEDDDALEVVVEEEDKKWGIARALVSEGGSAKHAASSSESLGKELMSDLDSQGFPITASGGRAESRRGASGIEISGYTS